jgi:hypothetical protein
MASLIRSVTSCKRRFNALSTGRRPPTPPESSSLSPAVALPDVACSGANDATHHDHGGVEQAPAARQPCHHPILTHRRRGILTVSAQDLVEMGADCRDQNRQGKLNLFCFEHNHRK